MTTRCRLVRKSKKEKFPSPRHKSKQMLVDINHKTNV